MLRRVAVRFDALISDEQPELLLPNVRMLLRIVRQAPHLAARGFEEGGQLTQRLRGWTHHDTIGHFSCSPFDTDERD
jgi:hypothetical protein